VLNTDYTFLNTVHWKRAVCLVVKGKVEVLQYAKEIISNAEKTVEIKLPLVIKLLKAIRSLYKNRVPFSKKNVMIRDDYTCVYCGSKERTTIDHVIPVSRGGKSTFENCVSACMSCNSKKGSNTPSEAKMFLKRQPYAPTISEFLRQRMTKLGVLDMLKELELF
jgi:5-methylcytosine-specific restriction endonuclease McrA